MSRLILKNNKICKYPVTNQMKESNRVKFNFQLSSKLWGSANKLKFNSHKIYRIRAIQFLNLAIKPNYKKR